MKLDKIEYEKEPHSFVSRKFLASPICQKCGLLALKNRFTEWAIDKGCYSSYHASYKQVRQKFTSLGG